MALCRPVTLALPTTEPEPNHSAHRPTATLHLLSGRNITHPYPYDPLLTLTVIRSQTAHSPSAYFQSLAHLICRTDVAYRRLSGGLLIPAALYIVLYTFTLCSTMSKQILSSSVILFMCSPAASLLHSLLQIKKHRPQFGSTESIVHSRRILC